MEIARRKKIVGNKEIKPDSLIHNAKYVGLTVEGQHYWLDTDEYMNLVKKISSNKITDFSQIWESGGDKLIVKHVPPRGTAKTPTELVKVSDVPGAEENIKRVNKSRGGGSLRTITMAILTLGIRNLMDTFGEGFNRTQEKPRTK
jgi:hypothetical protein